MYVIESLKTGRFGVELRMPPHLNVCRDEQECAEFVDKQKGMVWYLFLFPDLHLDLRAEHRADLRNSLEYYARSMFDDVFRQRNQGDTNRPPRTADPSWSPIIDVEHLSIRGAEALRTVHRMAYEPGREMIMGHLLIPLRQGLFEARVLCVDQMTGIRESVLVSKRMSDREPNSAEDIKQIMATSRQADYDDPRHDSMFPEHSLSRTRAALRWLQVESNVRVTEAPHPFADREVELEHLDCALVLPPRFAPEDLAAGIFCRVSFCGSDGVERLRVDRWDNVAQGTETGLPAVAKSVARGLHKASGIKKTRVTVETLAGAGQQAQALVVVEGNGHMGPLRNAMLFFRDDRQRTWSLSRFGTAAVPRDALAAELVQAVSTFRVIRPPKPPKPWWKFW